MTSGEFDIKAYGEDGMSARERLVDALEDHSCCFSTEDAEAFISAVLAEHSEQVICLLRDMDETQRRTDHGGGAEIAWYYQRDALEDALELSRGSLDAGHFTTGDQVMDYVESLAEEFGLDWPLTAPPGTELDIPEWWAYTDGWSPIRSADGTLTGFVREDG
jgi:hypothetical protein